MYKGNSSLIFFIQYVIPETLTIVSDFIDYNDADELLFFNGLTEGISDFNNEIIFSKPSSFSIYKANHQGVSLIYNIRDDKYIIDNKVDAKKLMQPPYDSAIQYTDDNSTIVGVSTHDNHIFVAAENKDISSEHKLIKKHIAIYKIDTLARKCSRKILKYPKNTVITRYCLYKNQLFYIEIASNGQSFISKVVINL